MTELEREADLVNECRRIAVAMGAYLEGSADEFIALVNACRHGH